MTKPIIPWPGGKTRLLKKIIPLVPEHRCYCEVFAGGAALLMAKEPVKSEAVNDTNKDLITLYRVVKYHLDEFVRHLRWLLVSREEFNMLLRQNAEGLTDIQKAVKFYYLQKLCFGGRTTGRTFGISTEVPARLNLLRVEEDLSAAHLRLARVTVENLDWAKLVDRYDRAHTFFFADPPYWRLQGYGSGFEWSEYELLADKLGSIKGKMLITLNDHPDVRKLFSDYIFDSVGINYTIGGKQKRANELLIANYDTSSVNT